MFSSRCRAPRRTKPSRWATVLPSFLFVFTASACQTALPVANLVPADVLAMAYQSLPVESAVGAEPVAPRAEEDLEAVAVFAAESEPEIVTMSDELVAAIESPLRRPDPAIPPAPWATAEATEEAAGIEGDVVAAADGAEPEEALTLQATAVAPPQPIEEVEEEEPRGTLIETGIASTYGTGDGFQGNRTACGQIFDTYVPQVAHKTLPCGTMLRVEDAGTGRSVTVKVTDRGPYIAGRVVDLSWAAYRQLDARGPGLLRVRVYRVS